jgi:outer membrane protein assembly factor BamA
VVLRQYRLQGLARTSPHFAETLSRRQTGDTLTTALLERIEQDAAAVSFVRFAPPLTVAPLPGYGEADVTLNFEEPRQIEIIGGLGRTNEAPPVWLWNLELRLRNLFGSGRRIGLLPEQRERDRRRLMVSYGQPLFVAGVGDMSVEVSTRDYRHDFYEFALRGEYALKLSPDDAGAFALSWRHVEPEDLSAAAAYSAYAAEVEYSRDDTDRRPIIRSGFRLTAALTYAYRRYSPAAGGYSPEREVLNETRARLGLEYWQPLKPLVTYASFGYRGLETGETEPPLSEMTLIGGPGSLRGYRNEQFAVSRPPSVRSNPDWYSMPPICMFSPMPPG